MTVDGDETMHDAHAEAASYHLQKFALRLPNTPWASLFDDVDGKKIAVRTTPSASYALLAHELTHFLQATTTVIGQSIVANWLAFLGHVYECFEDGAPILLPLHAGQSTKPQYAELLNRWNAYMRELKCLVGATESPVDASKLGGAGPFEFVDYSMPHPVDGTATNAIALVQPLADGNLVGVPLFGDAFLEGQAQAVQWLCDAQHENVDARLAGRPLKMPPAGGRFDGYYTAVLRFVRAKLPAWEPLRTTILLCDLALCSRKPAEAFVKAYNLLKGREVPQSWDDYRALRVAFDKCAPWVDDRTVMEEKLTGWPSVVEDAPAGTPPASIRTILECMRVAWRARSEEASIFQADEYGQAWLDTVTKRVGCPPIFTQERDVAVTLNGDDDFERACFFVRGTYDLIESLLVRNLGSKCPFLRSKVCDWHKEASCREGRLLDPPTRGGKSCHMGFAARGLGILNRPVKRLA